MCNVIVDMAGFKSTILLFIVFVVFSVTCSLFSVFFWFNRVFGFGFVCLLVFYFTSSISLLAAFLHRPTSVVT